MSAQQPAGGDVLPAAAILSAAAGIIHVKAAIDHAEHWWLFGVFFGALVCAQLGWALAVQRGRRDPWLADAAIVGSLAIVAIWLLSRTVGVPFGPWAWDAEPVGITDVVATLDELVLAGMLAALAHPRLPGARALTWMRGENAIRVVAMLGSASLFAIALADHTHG